MQTLHFFYIAKHAFKNLLMVLLGITLAITLIDYLQHANALANVANQTIGYLFYTWEFRLSQFYPLAIVFAAVITYMSLVKSNVWVSLRSFGYSKKQLFRPFALPALLLYGVLLFLQSGDFSYAREKAWSILHHTQNAHIVNDLFFKYNDSFVYVKSLDPIQKVLHDVTVFTLREGRVESATTLDMATFEKGAWVTENAHKSTKKYDVQGRLSGFTETSTGRYSLLKGYKPKVIELIYEGDSLSLRDALNTYTVLQKQGLDSSKIKANFYNKAVLPLFSLAILAILFFKTSYYSRYMNKELVWSAALGGTLVLWGLLYALYSLSTGGAILPELAILLPVLLLLCYAAYLYFTPEEKLN